MPTLLRPLADTRYTQSRRAGSETQDASVRHECNWSTEKTATGERQAATDKFTSRVHSCTLTLRPGSTSVRSVLGGRPKRPYMATSGGQAGLRSVANPNSQFHNSRGPYTEINSWSGSPNVGPQAQIRNNMINPII